MSRTLSLKRISPSHAILVVGIVVAILAVMFRPSGAVADLPMRANVYVKYNDTDYATVDLSKVSTVTQDYSIVPTGKSKPVISSFSGKPLVKFLQEVGTEDIGNIKFVRVRLNSTDDSRLAIVPLGDQNAERPPLMLASGKVGSRSLGTPALVPGQPDLGDPIEQKQIVGFSKSKPYVEILPAKPGADVLTVRIHRKQRTGGQYALSAAVIKGGSGAPAKYQWFQTDAKGNQALLGSGKSITTTATGTKDVVVSVVVTETSTGSTGIQYMTYIPKSSEKGKTTNPDAGKGGSGTGSGNGTNGTGTGNGVPGNGNGIATAPVPYTPPKTTSPSVPNTQVPPPDTTPQPTPSTGPATVDTTAITNAAQNVNGTGGLTTVSGVLLSTPTVPAAASGGGAPISALPAPVADQLNSIFQPVDSPDDVWPYLLAILFAFSISGAVREWVRP